MFYVLYKNRWKMYILYNVFLSAVENVVFPKSPCPMMDIHWQTDKIVEKTIVGLHERNKPSRTMESTSMYYHRLNSTYNMV